MTTPISQGRGQNTPNNYNSVSPVGHNQTEEINRLIFRCRVGRFPPQLRQHYLSTKLVWRLFPRIHMSNIEICPVPPHFNGSPRHSALSPPSWHPLSLIVVRL